MSVQHSRERWEFRCEGCGNGVSETTEMVPKGWIAITGNQITWSSINKFHGLRVHACSKDCALQVMTKLCQGAS